MKFFQDLLKSAACSFLLLLLCGCMNFEYTGREFPPLPQGKTPVWFQNKKLLPAGKYTIIGRAVVETGIKAEFEDIQEKLLEEAALRGADAVCLISTRTITRGMYDSDSYFDGPTDNDTNRLNLTPDGSPIQTDLSGQRIVLKGERGGTRRIIARALFLKETAALDKYLAARKKQLQDILQDPVPGNGKKLPEKKK